mmetsp:Transcript_27686/g.71855  ORF Transcript_27686/g.71855 Transcript_27686/m.71855 type:complete len:120 (-) Transcript_27686:252-611(-)|eukprot:jgi/Tetstr1/449362/TSEL_003874.t1
MSLLAGALAGTRRALPQLLTPAAGGTGALMRRASSAADSGGATPEETAISDKILRELPAQQAEVKDTSGGCGTMYKIDVVSPAFRGLSIVKQHQLVAAVLKEEIPRWHGFVLNTSAPKE